MNEDLQSILGFIALLILGLLFAAQERLFLQSRYADDEKCKSKICKTIRFLIKFFFWPEQQGSGNIGNLMYSRNKRIFNGRWYLTLTATYTGGLIFTALFFIFPPSDVSIGFYDENFGFKSFLLAMLSLVLRYLFYKFDGVSQLIYERKNNIIVEGEYPWQNYHNKKRRKQ
ncbi:hypothetical protein [Candidatus Thiodubiliella endoseptemdiera]|uniref:Uncharacterized protein n=1 Tax=Candidatus Thiodubiliella endoseptemdiera TaxID=2738886 RepID=A0A853F0V9_9GAMM|nr:hypothetical protein [Candidatus Thiodubiliella endoseptemdiera]